jgi:hypothetical protein
MPVEVVFLRLPTDLVQRVTRCTGILQTREGVNRNTTQAYARLLEIACEAVEHQQTPLVPVLAEIASISNGAPTDYDDMLACLGEEDEEETLALPIDMPQVSETPEPLADTPPPSASQVNGQGAPATQPPTHPAHVPQATETPMRHGRPGISRETLEAIADERTLCEGLSIREFSQRLFDKGIYRAKAKDGRAVPVDHSRLRRWLDQAREAGMML